MIKMSEMKGNKIVSINKKLIIPSTPSKKSLSFFIALIFVVIDFFYQCQFHELTDADVQRSCFPFSQLFHFFWKPD
jgi:hypothetical protein